MEIFGLHKIAECGTTGKLDQNSAKFSKMLEKRQTKYLRPNHFWKRTNFHNLAEKRPCS